MASKTVMVIGAGIGGLATSNLLADLGINVVLIEKKPFLGGHVAQFTCKATDECTQCGACWLEKERVSVLSHPRISTHCNSRITEVQHKTHHNITIQSEDFEKYGLKPSPNVISLSQLNGWIGQADQTNISKLKGRQIAFLTGFMAETHPVIAAGVLQAAKTLQEDYGCQSYVFVPQLKVAGPGLEELYHKAKSSGVVFFKLETSPPRVEQLKDHGHVVAFLDPTIQKRVQLLPDYIVVDETIEPQLGVRELAGILRIETDDTGYAQKANIHRLPVYTNRAGVYVAGASRGIHASWDDAIESDCVIVAFLRTRQLQTQKKVARPNISTGRCVRCLTCYRLCPYDAVELNKGHLDITAACESCQICMAACPRLAISIAQSDEPVAVQFTVTEIEHDSNSGFIPHLTVFGCERSAIPAAHLSSSLGTKRLAHVDLIPVPCAGGLATESVLHAFNKGTDGILIVTCHPGNCHSDIGEKLARLRFDHLAGTLSAMGVDAHRLKICSIAANGGYGFGNLLNDFAKRLGLMNPAVGLQQ